MLFAALVSAFLLRHTILRALAGALVEDDGPQKADCILVLGGDGFGCRITKAAELVEQGYAPYALVDGPRTLMGHESDVMIAYAEKQGFARALFRSVPLPDEIDSTRDESVYLADRILRPQHIHKVLLVTSNYHTRRAARTLRRTAPWLTVDVVAAPDPYFNVDGWWKTRSGKKTFLFEWMKTISEWWGH